MNPRLFLLCIFLLSACGARSTTDPGDNGVCVYAQQSPCDDINAPVCGCDGLTYENRCSWGELTPILHEGECEANLPE